MKKDTDTTSARERILETAADLFFHQGYRATGINEVIAQSGVAKATFYNHFPTKEDLCLAYLEDRNSSEFANIKAYVEERETARERFMAVIESIVPWLEANALRGCCFLNMVAEIPDPDNRLRQLGDRHYDMVHDMIRHLTRKLVAAEPERYGSIDVEQTARDYLTILVGAIALVEVYHDLWPGRHAIEMVRRLIG